ncbi:hypothetical protein [Actinoplanes sp. GCM10030250]|uniref:hypothetical protein n=1 Tax=Actinoplanes sp. GCM10030250 TaxID=3273376 RepID=UPI00361B169C
MHDDMLVLFDNCLARLLDLRDRLAATRCVRPGERHTTVLAAIAEAEHFASTATATVAASPAPQPATTGSSA